MTEFEPLPGDFYGYADLLPDEDKEVLTKVRRFLADKVAPIADECWERAEFPHHLVPDIAELGIVGLGMDWPDRPRRSKLLTSFIGLEFARVDPSMATFFGVHNGLAMASVDLCGSPEQKARWLPSMRSMEKIGAFGLTEPHGGSDVAGGLETTARRDGDAWVLDGAKRWIGNATFADLVIIWARDVADDQVKGFVVEKGTPGFEARKIERKLALRTVQNADLTLSGCRVPDANRLTGANSFRDTGKVLRLTRGGAAWSAVGAMMGAYELARDYAIERVQFGKPIAKFQLVQDHLATILSNVTASLGMAVRVAQLQDDGVFRDEQAAMAKSFCTSRLRESVAHAREIFGGNGIVLDYRIGRFFNDAEALYSYEGTREMNTLIVGRAATGMGAFV
ncbi:acyl-CoA dehydrogenase family protein [Amycolatopsis sp. CA-230715]|uniref:acyl-CoA dehydrogenase family protein n=1 Tax=Amycolatopsis sp. CA-230715 TaxID=2745196 RepID=UPI001C01E3C5|nr:acyl-CoA dehydrogenase family protein [Amycolatopsis sp. CA-230715]QWF79710.1 Acyl-CoA dehydrogenase [Amycolatopsis sp. CA-230715]